MQCLKRRPDDAAVWSAWLRLWASPPIEIDACAAGTLTHLPADSWRRDRRSTGSAPGLVLTRGDHDPNGKSWSACSRRSPDDLPALDRLAQLAEMAGQPATRPRRFAPGRAEIERLRARYEQLFDRNQPIRDAEEMADLAHRLGRAFEAEGFLTVEIAAGPRTRRPAAETGGARDERSPVAARQNAG